MVLKVSDIGEFELIERIQKIIDGSGSRPGNLIRGIGDDTAVFSPEPGQEMFVTCDSMVEGYHYLDDHITPFEIGKRAMVMNISDIGAMGGKPLYALVTVGLTPSESVGCIEDIYRGLISELKPFDASIIGGNITKVKEGRIIDITLMGSGKREHMVLRSGARDGDSIMVTGRPGRSAAGYWLVKNGVPESGQNKVLFDAYVRPEHRAKEGHALALSGKITSMIDLSDGLSSDLFHICEKSKVGAELMVDMFPECDAMDGMAGLYDINPLDFVLGASDDYELLFTCPPEYRTEVNDILDGLNCPVAHIGNIISAQGITILTKSGKKEKLSRNGWDHLKLKK